MKPKKLDIRTEKKAMFAIDAALNIIIFLCVTLPLLFNEYIGYKNFFIINILYSVMIMCFMTAFEEYNMTFSSFNERAVSIVLSNIYSFVTVSAANLCFFSKIFLFKVHLLLFGAILAAMLLTNYAFYKIIHNEKYFKKPKMFIIEGKNNDISRMKRVKYGTLAQYDSWYEPLDTENLQCVEEFIDKHFDNFDAICVFDNVRDDIYEMIVKKAMLLNKDFYVVPKSTDINRSHAKSVRFDDVLAFYVQKYSLSIVEEFFKRMFDIILSAAGMIIAAIPMLIIAAAIKLTSPGPVFYKQLRLTKNKREFYIYKFRTMVPDAEKMSGPVFAQKDDPRITKIGKLLRSCRLDELPQIINILKGDMSIVGPRPERPFFVEQFEKEIDNYDYRFVVKAGLTSLSHVYGRYSTYIQDRTCYDLLYISNYSFLLDLKIILLTTKTMFIRSAAEGEDEYKLASKSIAEKTEKEV